jgi:hypothetical protein
MSFDKCYRCEVFVDTDDDPDCYVSFPLLVNVDNNSDTMDYVCVCEICRSQDE